MEFSERLKELRKEIKETQVQVSAATGIAYRYYQNCEAGKNLPGFENLIALANHFHVTLDYLMCRTDRR